MIENLTERRAELKRKKMIEKAREVLAKQGVPIVNGIIQFPDMTNEQVLHIIMDKAWKRMLESWSEDAPPNEFDTFDIDELWEDYKGWFDETLDIAKEGAKEVGISLKEYARHIQYLFKFGDVTGQEGPGVVAD